MDWDCASNMLKASELAGVQATHRDAVEVRRSAVHHYQLSGLDLNEHDLIKRIKHEKVK